ncbi:hypothetical protein LINPERPRIM_LOCUS24884 [Linum perenne]
MAPNNRQPSARGAGPTLRSDRPATRSAVKQGKAKLFVPSSSNVNKAKTSRKKKAVVKPEVEKEQNETLQAAEENVEEVQKEEGNASIDSKGKGKAAVEHEADHDKAPEGFQSEKDGKSEEAIEQNNEAPETRKTIIIEHCTNAKAFKSRADEVADGLKIAVPGIVVKVNPETEMKRPFKLMMDLNMEEVIESIVSGMK